MYLICITIVIRRELNGDGIAAVPVRRRVVRVGLHERRGAGGRTAVIIRCAAATLSGPVGVEVGGGDATLEHPRRGGPEEFVHHPLPPGPRTWPSRLQ